MKGLVKTLEGLPWIIRLLLVLFVGVYGNLLRLLKSLAKGNVVGIILAVICLCTGGFGILWIVDLICVLINKPIWWIDE